MATAIRNIPILFGNEATSFENEAKRVEANPGSVHIKKTDAEIVKKMIQTMSR